MHRGRRLRKNESIRALTRETTLSTDDLIYPLFVVEGEGRVEPVDAMPGVSRYSVDRLDAVADEVAAAGIRAVLLFGIPAAKDSRGSGAYDPNGVVPRAIRRLKGVHPELLVIADVCLCEYTDHGHCGLVDHDGCVLNDKTLPLLSAAAVAYARAGADVIAPSDMMDGRVAAIRTALDEAGLKDVAILSYLTRRNSRVRSTVRSATRREARPRSATGAAIRWIRRTDARRFAKSRQTLRRGRTWSSPSLLSRMVT